ncbi:MAG: GNAT family N-acetyltransferase [Treponema sp.]|jgi:ribosomal protein S18 acetylase RimI-like enzyme|nr:GNAT family N-acetyltransferase [Treponema sp.]
MKAAPRWELVRSGEYEAVAKFLARREPECVAACSRFLQMRGGSVRGARDKTWVIRNSAGEIESLLLYSRRSLLPVLDGKRHIPAPRFLRSFLSRPLIYAVQGTKGDDAILESILVKCGYSVSERIDYDLMGLDGQPDAQCFRLGPSGLVIRRPEKKDLDELFTLQSAYEQEEVLPGKAVFNPAVSRANLGHIFNNERMLLSCLNGRIVGKINTSASSFSRYQIGGVYVRPEYRGMGIAGRMAAVFVKGLVDEGRGVTLFVKKSNPPARAVYRRLGFSIQGDYRITYY